MNLNRPTFLYALAGCVGGLLLGLLVVALYGVLHFLPEPIWSPDMTSDSAVPWGIRIAMAYLGGGVIGGAIWGALHDLTQRLWGAVLTAFLAALPLFSFLSLAVGDLEPPGILIRSFALAMIVGIGRLAVPARLIGRAPGQTPPDPSEGTSGGSSNEVAESSRVM